MNYIIELVPEICTSLNGGFYTATCTDKAYFEECSKENSSNFFGFPSTVKHVNKKLRYG